MNMRPDRILGPGHDTFWSWCNNDELRLQRCTRCNAISWPVVFSCELCGTTDFAWDRMSGRGRIASWCTFERDYYDGILPIPWETILVEFDEGPLFISNPLGFTLHDIELNMPVVLVFIDCEDTNGQFRLPVFSKA